MVPGSVRVSVMDGRRHRCLPLLEEIPDMAIHRTSPEQGWLDVPHPHAAHRPVVAGALWHERGAERASQQYAYEAKIPLAIGVQKHKVAVAPMDDRKMTVSVRLRSPDDATPSNLVPAFFLDPNQTPISSASPIIPTFPSSPTYLSTYFPLLLVYSTTPLILSPSLLLSLPTSSCIAPHDALSHPLPSYTPSPTWY